nr:MAG TPA: hypothetical protein [Caudoviricetes sp.]
MRISDFRAILRGKNQILRNAPQTTENTAFFHSGAHRFLPKL